MQAASVYGTVLRIRNRFRTLLCSAVKTPERVALENGLNWIINVRWLLLAVLVRTRPYPSTCSAWPPSYNDLMSTISVQEIQHNPLVFLQRIEAGEAFVVVRGDCALAEVRPLARGASEPRPFGLCAGQFTVPANFDQPLPDDILKEFERG